MNNLNVKCCRKGIRLIKRLLGQILVDGEFVSRHDIERALDEQLRTNKMLGEILVQMGVLDSRDLRAALSVSSELASLENAVKVAAGVRQTLGNLLLKAKRITPEQLEFALQEQQKTGEKIGEILVRFGSITTNELDALLKFQKHQDAKTPAPGKLRLGEILVATGYITREQLEDSLIRQQFSRKNIGDVLVEAGYIQPNQLSYGLNLQNKLLTAALVAVLSLAPLSNTIYAESLQNDSNLNNTSKFAEEVQLHTAMKVVYQTSELIITKADILRGYVDIPLGAHVVIQNNNLAGYMVVFEGLGGPFKEIVVKGLGEDTQISSKGGWIAQPYNGRDPLMVELSYTFILSKDAQPGTYTWPISISVSPIIPV